MSKKLVVIGGGAFCWEIMSWANFGLDHDWEFKGFLDDNVALENHKNYLGSIAEYKIQNNDCFICAIGNAKIRLKICNEFARKKAHFINIVHPSAIVSNYARIGRGCIIGPHAHVSYEATIGNYVVVNASGGVGHNTYLDEGCVISSYACLTGYVHLEKGVFLAPHVSIIPGKRIKEFSIIGPGSVVLRDIKETGTYFGVPAKRVA